MTTATFTSDPGISQTAVTWKANVKGLHDALIAVGLVQTSDTGQYDVNAIAAVPAQNASGGYTMYRFNDSLAGSAPIYLRIDWFTVNAATLKPSVRFSVGQGSNGAGVLTSPLGGTRTLAAISTTAASASVTSYLAAGDGYLCICLWPGATSQNSFGFFIIERHRDDSNAVTGGVITGLGVVVASGPSDIVAYDLATQTAYSHNYCLTYPPTLQTVSPSSGNPLLFPMTVFCPGQTPFQPVCFMAVAASERPGSTFSITLGAIPGTSRTYIAPATPTTATLVSSGTTGVANSTVMRWQ